MRPLILRLASFLRNEDGPTGVEYAVILSLIIVVCIGAITSIGKNANATFSNVSLNMVLSGSSGS
jgi:pilus assembly protein Flp/PilA